MDFAIVLVTFNVSISFTSFYQLQIRWKASYGHFQEDRLKGQVSPGPSEYRMTTCYTKAPESGPTPKTPGRRREKTLRFWFVERLVGFEALESLGGHGRIEPLTKKQALNNGSNIIKP